MKLSLDPKAQTLHVSKCLRGRGREVEESFRFHLRYNRLDRLNLTLKHRNPPDLSTKCLDDLVSVNPLEESAEQDSNVLKLQIFMCKGTQTELLKSQPLSGRCQKRREKIEHLDQQAAPPPNPVSPTHTHTISPTLHIRVASAALRQLVKKREAGIGSQLVQTQRTISGRGEEGEVDKLKDEGVSVGSVVPSSAGSFQKQ